MVLRRKNRFGMKHLFTAQRSARYTKRTWEWHAGNFLLALLPPACAALALSRVKRHMDDEVVENNVASVSETRNSPTAFPHESVGPDVLKNYGARLAALEARLDGGVHGRPHDVPKMGGVAELLFEHVGVDGVGGTLIDVGGGDNLDSAALHAAGFNVTVVDKSAQRLALASQRCKGVKTRVLDVTLEPLPRGPWSVVCMSTPVDQTSSVVPMVCSLLKQPGGVLVVASVCSNGAADRKRMASTLPAGFEVLHLSHDAVRDVVSMVARKTTPERAKTRLQRGHVKSAT